MILMFYNDAYFIHWRARDNTRYIKGHCEFNARWPERVAASIGRAGPIEAISYFLHHGGQKIRKPAGFLTPQNFNELAQCIKYLPQYNDLTCKIAGYWLKALPQIPHILLCDTAYFTRLPYTASNYAIPHQLQRQDVRRYGRYGLSHQWITNRIHPLIGMAQPKLISVYLGNHTNMAALNGSRPLETSFGFTTIEGMPSLTGSGNIDPTIVFNLHANGMSFKEINTLLSQKSGLAALAGQRTGLAAIFRAKPGSRCIAARDFYCYNVRKLIGSFVATLGGIDALVFFSEQPKTLNSIIPDICRSFKFLGLECKKSMRPGKNIWDLTGKSSRVKIYCVRHNTWSIIEDYSVNLLRTRRIRQ